MASLFRFRSRECPDLLMLAADAERLLRIMTGDAPAKGILPHARMNQALQALRQAVLEDEAARQEAAQAESGEESDAQDKALPAIRLAQRAQPMINTLERCQREQCDLVWGV